MDLPVLVLKIKEKLELQNVKKLVLLSFLANNFLSIIQMVHAICQMVVVPRINQVLTQQQTLYEKVAIILRDFLAYLYKSWFVQTKQ